MPDNQALQVFYGTIPLLLIVFAVCFRKPLLLEEIVKRLGSLEVMMDPAARPMTESDSRLRDVERFRR